MKKRQNSKGLSAVVTTLLIILLSIAAIGIVWVVVKNLVEGASTGISFEKFSLNLGISDAYVDTTAGSVSVVVRRSVGAGNLTGVYFIFSNGTSSVSVKRSISLKELEEETFTFSSTEVGGINSLERVSVSPVYASGSKDVIGGITDTFEISEGTGTGGGTGGGFCGDGICNASSGETSSSCPQDCAVPPSCNGAWQGSSEDPGVVCDGGLRCLASCTCQIGYVADGSGGCVSEPSLSFGTIDSVWPASVGKYFDSQNLPKDSSQIVAFIGKYANFTGAETRCLQISYAEYLFDPAYNKSYIRLELPAAITPGDSYEIWTSSSCGV